MLVKEILNAAVKPVFSFEFFPPKKDEDWETLFETIAALSPLNPSTSALPMVPAVRRVQEHIIWLQKFRKKQD